jgi:glycine hydroxymethyltransferase
MNTRNVLFVCTGNICRSPMAECMFNASRHAGQKQWKAHSAGISAMQGMRASLEAIHAMHDIGLDLKAHRSQPVTGELVDAASIIVVMTEAHRSTMLKLFPGTKEKTFLLGSFRPDGKTGDIADPIGCSVEVYRIARDHIGSALGGLMDFLREMR